MLATLTGSSRFILVGLATLTGPSRLILFYSIPFLALTDRQMDGQTDGEMNTLASRGLEEPASETVLCPILWGINLSHIYAREVR